MGGSAMTLEEVEKFEEDLARAEEAFRACAAKIHSLCDLLEEEYAPAS